MSFYANNDVFLPGITVVLKIRTAQAKTKTRSPKARTRIGIDTAVP